MDTSKREEKERRRKNVLEHQLVQPAGDPATYIAIQQQLKAKNNALAGVMTPASTKRKGNKTKASVEETKEWEDDYIE